MGQLRWNDRQPRVETKHRISFQTTATLWSQWEQKVRLLPKTTGEYILLSAGNSPMDSQIWLPSPMRLRFPNGPQEEKEQGEWQPGGKGKRLPEVYCIISRLGCFSLFSKILDEVEKRRGISPALVQPLMRSVMEAPFPALGKTILVKNFLPGSGTEVIELCRPLDSRLEHVDFESLFSSLSVRHLVCVFASLLLERRVIFIADKLRYPLGYFC
ncbi:hypothetical protein P7K49_025771 [Saguinus oedipus]|uniref:UDENN domain-containing protein n=1 Tax=Saguinus oedipus TaxID=9490 RepID=A0ABQ9UI50_SAGOE|nr:hypothetical protein P7K49_025771 [Saguinus oedipus]